MVLVVLLSLLILLIMAPGFLPYVALLGILWAFVRSLIQTYADPFKTHTKDK
jgi:hypothetical protein